MEATPLRKSTLLILLRMLQTTTGPMTNCILASSDGPSPLPLPMFPISCLILNVIEWTLRDFSIPSWNHRTCQRRSLMAYEKASEAGVNGGDDDVDDDELSSHWLI